MLTDRRLQRFLPFLMLTGCVVAPPPPQAALPPPVAATARVTADAAAATNIADFVDPAAFARLTEHSKAAAAAAQYGALQFGRVGAPRQWIGETGQSGAVTVGPYVRVNLVDCRDFTNKVAVGAEAFERSGTACREADGSWTVSL